MAVYAAFPRSIRLLRACCSRVTHPCAGRRQKYCYSLAAPRLACVKPAASVHPEPGSNSSLYIFYLYSSSTILTSSSLKGIYALMYFVLPYTSHTFFQVCCLSLSLFQSTVVRFPNGIAKVRLFSFIPNPNQKFLHFFWNYFSPQQSPQRNSLKNSTLSQISTEGNFFVNFYFLNIFVTKSANKRKSQQTQITTSADCNKYRLQQAQMGAIIQCSTPLRSLYP